MERTIPSVFARSEQLGSTLGQGTYRFIKFCATGSKHGVGIWFVGKMLDHAAPAAGVAPPTAAMPAAQPGRLFKICASASVPRVPVKGDCEKSPLRSAAVGTMTGSEEIPWTTRRPS